MIEYKIICMIYATQYMGMRNDFVVNEDKNG